MSVHTPKYRLHKASGQALVQLNGRRIYLGKYEPRFKEQSCAFEVLPLFDGE